MTSCRTEADGDSLGECTTNVFVLADARGLRWKKFATSYSSATTISEDPVLASYSKALSLDLMCIWQRSTSYNLPIKEEPGSNRLLDCPKELVLFWYGEEPVLTGVISASLKEVNSGSFDNGFSSEYQNHLYKALHNLIERHLLNSGFVRMGKWFMKPIENDLGKRESSAFSFSFFIYGESLVATTVEVDKRPSVRRVNKDDVTSANSCTGLPAVVLAPYGLKAVLTGNSLPHCDAQASKLISDWNRFFSLSASMNNDTNANAKESVPPIVEVAVKDTRMLFPSNLVVMPLANKEEGSSGYGNVDEKPKIDAGKVNVATDNRSSTPNQGESLCSKIWQQLGAKKENIKPASTTVKTEGLSSSSSTTALWDFRESLRHTACGCTSSSNVTRTKPLKKFCPGVTVPRSNYSPVDASPKVSSPVTPQGGTNVVIQRSRRDPKKPIAFHQRASHLTDRAHTPPLLPVLPGPRTLHPPKVIQGFGNVPLVTEESLNRRTNNSYSVNLKPKSEQADNSSSETTRTVETNLSEFHNQLAQLKSSINASSYLNKKVFKRKCIAKRKPLYRLPSLVSGRPILQEDHLQSARPTEDFSIYSSQDLQTPHKEEFSVKFIDAYMSLLSPSSTDAEKLKRIKRPVSSENIDSSVRKIKKSEPFPVTDLPNAQLLGTDTVQRLEPSARLPTPQGNDKKHRGQGRPRGRRESNTQSPKSELASPISDVFSPVFDDETEPLSFVGSAKRKPSKGKETGLPMSSPPRSSMKETKTGHPRGKKRTQAGRGRKDLVRQEGSYKPKESYNVLLNPPPHIILPTSAKNAPPPSPQPSHFSPPTPRHSAGSGFLNFNDLQVSENDLNMIFESDEEEDTPKPYKALSHLDGHLEDQSKTAFSQSVVTSAGLTQQDLAQMFPTPPSQEPQIHATSPATPSQIEYINMGSVQPVPMLSPEKISIQGEREISEVKTEPCTLKQMLPPVFELPMYGTHPSGTLFSPVTGLPSSSLPPITSEIPTYKSSTSVKHQLPEMRTMVIPPLRIKSPPDLALAGINVSPGLLCQKPLSAVSASVLPGAAIIRPPLPTPTEIPPLTPSPLIKTLRPEFPLPSTLGSYDMDSQSLRMTLILSDSVMNCFGQKVSDSSDVNVWLSEVDANLWTGSVSHEIKSSSWPLFIDDTALPDVRGRLNFTHGPAGVQKRPFTLPLSESNILKSEKEKGKTEINQAFLKVISDQWASPFSAQYLEDIIDSVYSSVRTWNTPLAYNDSYMLEILQDLRPRLQEALQNPLRRCSWESAKVEGPSTFHSFHKFASKVGLQGNFAVQPLLAGHDGDWMSLSPYALRYWEKLLLEPFGGRRDVAYIAVAPDSETVVENTIWFLKELSSLYESLNLGQHSPITKGLRDGVMRLKESMMQRLAQDNVDDWFTQGEGSDHTKMKLFAQACKGYLGPHLTLVSGNLTTEKPSFNSADPSKGKGPMSPAGVGAHPSAAEEAILEEEKDSTPAIVIYMVDPFQGKNAQCDSPLWSVTGLFRSFAEMIHNLPAQLKENVFLQVVPVDLMLRVKVSTGAGSSLSLRPRDLRQLAISVYSQCRAPAKLLSTAKALTGFGNAVVRENLVFKRQNDNQLPARIYLPPCVLAQPPGLVSEDVHSLKGFDKALKTQDINVLYCGYCISSDQRWLFTVCSDKSGEISETCIIKISSGVRNIKGSTNTRMSALRRLWDFVYNIISFTTNPWRIVFNRFGQPGKGELHDFTAILRKVVKSKTTGKPRPQEACRACNSANIKNDCPVIRSVSYTTIDTDTGINLLHRTKRTKNGIARSRVYIVPPLQSSSNQQTVKPQAQRAPVAWAERAEDGFLSDPAALLLGGPEEDGPDSDFLPLLASPADPSNLVYGSDLISPSPEIQDTFLTDAGLSSGAVCESDQLNRLNSSRLKTNTSPFQPISQKSASFGSPLTRKSSPGVTPTGPISSEETDQARDQPLAVGYLLSSCTTPRHGNSQTRRSLVIRSDLRYHFVSEDAQPCLHHLDSNNNLEVLRYLLEQLDALSWLTVDPATGDRRSQLAVHLYLLRGMSNYFQHLYS